MHGYIDIGDAVNRDAPLNRGLVSWWLALPGQQRGVMLRDLMGRNHGTLTNGPAWLGSRGRPGGHGTLSFDGSNDYVNLPAMSTHSQWAISAWMYLNAVVDGTQYTVFAKDASGFFDDVLFGVNPNSGNVPTATKRIAVVVHHTPENVVRHVKNTSDMAANTWYHATATTDGATLRLYVNGVLVDSLNDGTNFGIDLSTPSSPQIGRCPQDSSRFWNGLLDDIRFYTRDVSGVAGQLYQASRLGYPNELNWIQRPAFAPEQGGGGGFNPVYARWSNIVIQPLTAA